MAFVRVLTLLMKHPQIGKRVVPIIPDEARTFGMESLFRQFGIYASQGQLYKPHDAEMFLYYKESKDGQILEEGITEAGLHGVVHGRRDGVRELRRGDDSVLHLLLDVRLPARGRPHLGLRAMRAARASCAAAPPAAPRSPAKACSTRTATASCTPAPCPPASPTIRRSPTRSRSSCRTASGACIRSRRTASTT